MNEWAEKRLQELKAAAPVKRKKADPFVKVPLWWAEAAAKATRTLKAKLEKKGVARETKRRALRELELAGLIKVTWRRGKTPDVTIVIL